MFEDGPEIGLTDEGKDTADHLTSQGEMVKYEIGWTVWCASLHAVCVLSQDEAHSQKMAKWDCAAAAPCRLQAIPSLESSLTDESLLSP